MERPTAARCLPGAVQRRPGLRHQRHLQRLQVHPVDAVCLHRVRLLVPRALRQLLRSRLQEQVSSQGKQSKGEWGTVSSGQRFHRQAIPPAHPEHHVLPRGGHGHRLQEAGLSRRLHVTPSPKRTNTGDARRHRSDREDVLNCRI